ATVSPPTPESNTPMGASVGTDAVTVPAYRARVPPLAQPRRGCFGLWRARARRRACALACRHAQNGPSPPPAAAHHTRAHRVHPARPDAHSPAHTELGPRVRLGRGSARGGGGGVREVLGRVRSDHPRWGSSPRAVAAAGFRRHLSTRGRGVRAIAGTPTPRDRVNCVFAHPSKLR